MINNLHDEKVENKIGEETERPEILAIHEVIAASEGEYSVNPDSAGLDYNSHTIVKGHPNRCRLKLYHPKNEILVAWFYKKSQVPYSRDRFSYGGVVWPDIPGKDLRNIKDEITQWLEWLDSGLHPEKRPGNWTSVFPYDLPE